MCQEGPPCQTQYGMLGYRNKNTKCPDFMAADQLKDQERADAAYASVSVPSSA